jgi:hypothetical protein
MHQIKKQLSHPNLHSHHIQGDVLQSIAKAIHQTPSPIHYYKVKSHAEIIGNEYATLLLENQSQPTLTLRIPPSKQLALRKIPSTTSTGLQREYEEHRVIQNHLITSQSPSSRLWYLSNYHDALQAHMHPLLKLGNANTVANYHEYYQTFYQKWHGQWSR